MACGSGNAVVLADRVADAAEPLDGSEGQPPDVADQRQQVCPGVPGYWWWNGCHGRSLQAGFRSRPRLGVFRTGRGRLVDLGQSAESPRDVAKRRSTARNDEYRKRRSQPCSPRTRKSAEGLAVNVRKFVVRATISTTWWVNAGTTGGAVPRRLRRRWAQHPRLRRDAGGEDDAVELPDGCGARPRTRDHV